MSAFQVGDKVKVRDYKPIPTGSTENQMAFGELHGLVGEIVKVYSEDEAIGIDMAGYRHPSLVRYDVLLVGHTSPVTLYQYYLEKLENL